MNHFFLFFSLFIKIATQLDVENKLKLKLKLLYKLRKRNTREAKESIIHSIRYQKWKYIVQYIILGAFL